MGAAVSPLMNDKVSSKYRILGSTRSGAFRQLGGIGGDGCTIAMQGDCDAMRNAGIRMNSGVWYWLGARYEGESGSSKQYEIWHFQTGTFQSGTSQIARTWNWDGGGQGNVWSRSVCPVFDVKPETLIQGGSGTFDDPWVIADNS